MNFEFRIYNAEKIVAREANLISNNRLEHMWWGYITIKDV